MPDLDWRVICPSTPEQVWNNEFAIKVYGYGGRLQKN